LKNGTFQITTFEGDGIGHEIMPACLFVLEAVQRRIGGFKLEHEKLEGGVELYHDKGTDLTEEAFEAARRTDAILFGAMGLPEVRLPDGTEIAPHLRMPPDFVRCFDSSVGGLGGCPFAAGATVNICTEDLLFLPKESGYETGVDLIEAIDVAHKMEEFLGKQLAGQVMRRGPAPVPALCERRQDRCGPVCGVRHRLRPARIVQRDASLNGELVIQRWTAKIATLSSFY
jgi:hypothetical protein